MSRHLNIDWSAIDSMLKIEHTRLSTRLPKGWKLHLWVERGVANFEYPVRPNALLRWGASVWHDGEIGTGLGVTGDDALELALNDHAVVMERAKLTAVRTAAGTHA